MLVCYPRTHAETWARRLYLCPCTRVWQCGRGDVVLCAGTLRRRDTRHVNNVFVSNTSLFFVQMQGQRASAPGLRWAVTGRQPVRVCKKPRRRRGVEGGLRQRGSPSPSSGGVRQRGKDCGRLGQRRRHNVVVAEACPQGAVVSAASRCCDCRCGSQRLVHWPLQMPLIFQPKSKFSSLINY